MARTMVNCKLSIYLPNCRKWQWVPTAVRSTHASFAAVLWPVHAAWRCRKIFMLAQLARTLTEWHCHSFTDLIDKMELWDWNVATQRLLISIGKVVAQSKSVSHVGRKHGPKVRFNARPWKDGLGNGNAVYPEVQDAAFGTLSSFLT